MDSRRFGSAVLIKKTMTKEQFEKVCFRWNGHISTETMHTTCYVSEDGLFSFYDHVPYKNGEPHGKCSRTFAYRGKRYNNYDEFLKAIEKL